MNKAADSRPTLAMQGFRASWPLMLGYIPLGLVFGASGAQHGLSALGAGLMAGVNYAGGSEFAAISLWSAAPPIAAIALATLMINARHVMYSAALTPYVGRLTLLQKLAVFALMSDECWAVAMRTIAERRRAGASDADALQLFFYLGLGVPLWVAWWSSAFAGAALSSGLGDLTSWGFGMAFPATFIAILASMWPGARHCVPWVLSFAVAGVLSLFISSPWAIAAGAALGLLWTWFFEKGD